MPIVSLCDFTDIFLHNTRNVRCKIEHVKFIHFSDFLKGSICSMSLSKWKGNLPPVIRHSVNPFPSPLPPTFSRTSDDIDMKLGPVTKLYKRNKNR